MTPDQTAALDKARQSALALKSQADKARSLGLTVLEQWLRDASVGCQAGADFQARAMSDNLLTQTEKVVVNGKPKHQHTANCATDPTCPGHKQTDALAAAMIRRADTDGLGLRCPKCGHSIAECRCP